MTIMVLSVVISVTLAIVELSLKQLALSVDTRDSEVAFHAANAGLECARYLRRHSSSTFERGGQTVPFDCFGVSGNMAKLATTSVGIIIDTNGPPGYVHRYQKDIPWPSGNRCSSLDILTMIVGTSTTAGDLSIRGMNASPLDGLNTVFPSYPTKTKKCPQGGICTIVSVSGYNSSCTGKDKAGVLKRQVLLEF